MPQFFLSVHSTGSPRRTEEERRSLLERIDALEAEMRESGALVSQGALLPAHRAKVVDARADQPTVTDGPFAESKEHLGGYYIIETDTEERALDWAAKTSACIGEPIEVREFFDRRDG